MSDMIEYQLKSVIWSKMRLEDDGMYLIPRWPSLDGVNMATSLRKAFPQLKISYSFKTDESPIIVEGEYEALKEFEKNYIRYTSFDDVIRVYVPKQNLAAFDKLNGANGTEKEFSRYKLRDINIHDNRLAATVDLFLMNPDERTELTFALKFKFPQLSVTISYDEPGQVVLRQRKHYIKHFVENYIHHVPEAGIYNLDLPSDSLKPYLECTYIDTDTVRYDQFAKIVIKEECEMNEKEKSYTVNDIMNTMNSVYGYTFNWSPKARYFHPSMVKNVIFNPPATIVFWVDGSKTVVKCTKNEPFDPEKGMLMAIIKHCFNDGSTRTSKWMKKFTKKGECYCVKPRKSWWYQRTDGLDVCAYCGATINRDIHEKVGYAYCPGCGSKMNFALDMSKFKNASDFLKKSVEEYCANDVAATEAVVDLNKIEGASKDGE